LGVGGRVPHFVPGAAFVVFAGVDDLEHVLGWVLVGAATARAIVFEVVEESFGVLADFPEVDGFATFCLIEV
jgi:hypothetical protein